MRLPKLGGFGLGASPAVNGVLDGALDGGKFRTSKDLEGLNVSALAN